MTQQQTEREAIATAYTETLDRLARARAHVAEALQALYMTAGADSVAHAYARLQSARDAEHSAQADAIACEREWPWLASL
jgi:hypothetical protein